MGSQALFDLCDGHTVELTVCRREASGRELYGFCTELIHGTEIDIARFAPTEETKGNIVYYHKTGKKINEREMIKAIKGLDESQLIRLEANEKRRRRALASRGVVRGHAGDLHPEIKGAQHRQRRAVSRSQLYRRAGLQRNVLLPIYRHTLCDREQRWW